MICILFLRSAGYQKGIGHDYVSGPPPRSYPDTKPKKPRKERSARSRGKSKLTEKEVCEIRAMAGTMSNSKIAAIYGISKPSVQAIISRRNWGDVH